MLCESCQNLNLDEICGLTNKTGYELQPKPTQKSHQGGALICDLCRMIFGKSSFKQAQNIKSAEDGILPISIVAVGNSDSTFNVFCHQNDPNTTLVRGSTLGLQLESDGCITVASRWLQECILQSGHAHKYCPKAVKRAMPSRVLNVGPSDGSKEPYLQDTKGLNGLWVALSHCWGTSVPVTTTTRTLESRKKQIPLADLPHSFRDAVIITRKLGFSHLWIDSLCIIQDSANDWNMESGLMGDIFSNAVVCIAAEAAPNSSSGIFGSSNKDRLSELVQGRYISPSTATEGPLSFRRRVEKETILSFPEQKTPLISMEGPLIQRAWTLQENFLAPRIIRYGEKQLKWSCRSFQSAEDDPHRRSLCDNAKSLFQHFKEWHRFRTQPSDYRTIRSYKDDESILHILQCWYNIVNEYMSRKLTKEDDRLPAVAGLAKEISHQTDTKLTYVAGLWLEDIHKGLLWCTNGRAMPTELYAAPSWSWASVQGARLTQTYRERGLWQMRHEILKEKLSSQKAVVINTSVALSSSDPYLKVQSATLSIQGLTYGFDDLLKASTPSFQQGKFKRSKKLMGSVTFCELDLENKNLWTPCDLQSRGIIYLQIIETVNHQHLGMTENMAFDNLILWALILEPTDETAKQYKRIGIAEICSGDSMFAGWTRRDIEIV